MLAQQNKLKELFDRYGWELIETQLPTDWWIAEVWLIKSKWTPTDCFVFLSFVVDPQSENRTERNFDVWAINSSLKQPLYWRDDNFYIDCSDDDYEQFPIQCKWERRVPKFFDSLSNLREKYSHLKKQ